VKVTTTTEMSRSHKSRNTA